MIVRGRQLVSQASQRLLREGVSHGVLMNNHKHYHPDELIQICSIDTLHSRELKPPAKLIVVDECHLATSKTYKIFLGSYHDAFVLGCTATPYSEKRLTHLADKIINPISFKELVEQGYLVDARYFCPYLPNLSKVRIDSKSKDYRTKDLLDIMDKSNITGDIVHHWKTLGENRPTLCFAVSIEHSKHIVSQFNDAGIPAIHCDADTSSEDRDIAISKLNSGEIKIISNVGVFSTGVDIPILSCLILARPTKSYSLFIQQLGRGTRTFEGKKDFVVLDHAANVPRHGFIINQAEGSLEGTFKNSIVSPKICKVCFMAYVSTHCKVCGPLAKDISPKALEIKEGELRELTVQDPIKLFISEMKIIARARGFKPGWTYFRVKDKFGEEMANLYLPKKQLPGWVLKKYGK